MLPPPALVGVAAVLGGLALSSPSRTVKPTPTTTGGGGGGVSLPDTVPEWFAWQLRMEPLGAGMSVAGGLIGAGAGATLGGAIGSAFGWGPVGSLAGAHLGSLGGLLVGEGASNVVQIAGLFHALGVG